jgi:hypothetical protein
MAGLFKQKSGLLSNNKLRILRTITPTTRQTIASKNFAPGSFSQPWALMLVGAANVRFGAIAEADVFLDWSTLTTSEVFVFGKRAYTGEAPLHS